MTKSGHLSLSFKPLFRSLGKHSRLLIRAFSYSSVVIVTSGSIPVFVLVQCKVHLVFPPAICHLECVCTKGNECVFLYKIYAFFCMSACFVNWSIDILINMYYTFNNTHTHIHTHTHTHTRTHTHTHTRGLHACVYTQHKKEREAHRRTREALRAIEDDHKKLKESKLYCLGEDVHV